METHRLCECAKRYATFAGFSSSRSAGRIASRRANNSSEIPGALICSTIAMTLDVYGHIFPREDDGEELAAAERALLG